MCVCVCLLRVWVVCVCWCEVVCECEWVCVHVFARTPGLVEAGELSGDNAGQCRQNVLDGVALT